MQLQCRNIKKTFDGTVFIDLTANFNRGTITVISGDNGSGKSTLLNLIGGQLRPDSGSVHLGEHRLTGRPVWQVAREGVRRTFQDGRLALELTLYEHLCVAASNTLSIFDLFRKLQVGVISDNAWNLIKTAGLSGRLGERAGVFSFGQRRLVNLAMAVTKSPSVLLLDEPFAGMSDELMNSAWELILRIASAGGIVLMVEHRMPPSGVEVNKLVLHNGRLSPDDGSVLPTSHE